MQGKRIYGEAYLTIYLALCMTIMLSLCLTLIEGARRNAGKLETECITDMGLNSVMAEYHRELFQQYNLLAIDSSYGTAMNGITNVERHLRRYLERNMSMEDIFLEHYWYRDFLQLSLGELQLTQVSILTDDGGRVFRQQAVEAIKDDIGLSLLQEMKEWLIVVESNELTERDVFAQKQEVDRQIQEYDGIQVKVGENKWNTVQIENPTEKLEEKRKKGVLKLVIEKPEEISSRAVNLEGLIEHRMRQGKVNQGNINQENMNAEELDLFSERFFFQEYLLHYMGHYGAEKDASALQYQLEYLIAGKNNDTENLKSTVNSLLMLREAANAVYLFSDSEKCMEAELIATAVATLLTVPEIAGLLKASLLLGWAFAESLYDVKALLNGARIPLLKDAETWHFGLQGALQLDELRSSGEGKGLSYEDYIRIFLCGIGEDVLTCRAMNMVEADIRLTPGNRQFRLDGCFEGIEAYIEVKSAFGSQYEMERSKFY